jgi:hypothetical protein
MNDQVYLRLHTPAKPRQAWNLAEVRIGYDHFSDLDVSSYGFNRLSQSASSSFEFRRDIADMRPPWWQNMFLRPDPWRTVQHGKARAEGVADSLLLGIEPACAVLLPADARRYRHRGSRHPSWLG